MKTILVVEDSEEMQDAVELTMKGRARCLRATTLTEASDLFVKYLDEDEIDAILVDGSVPVGSGPYEEMSPEEWVRRVRNRGFQKPMIAFSADPRSQSSLIWAGCDKQFAKGEESLGKLLELLGIPDAPN